MLWQEFSASGWIAYLDIISGYTRHRSIGMTPVEASERIKEKVVSNNLYCDHTSVSRRPSKFKVPDNVRISKYKKAVFEKGYTPNWIEEVFVVSAVV